MHFLIVATSTDCNSGFEKVISGLSEACIYCSKGKYNPVPGGMCRICPPGAICEGDAIASEKGFWQSPMNSFYRCQRPTHCCLAGNCKLDDLSRCGSHRNISSILCGECNKGYSDWTGRCVECAGVDWLLIGTLFFVCAVIIAILVWKNPDQSAFFKLLTDYAQLVALVIAPASAISQSLMYSNSFFSFLFIYLFVIR